MRIRNQLLATLGASILAGVVAAFALLGAALAEHDAQHALPRFALVGAALMLLPLLAGAYVVWRRLLQPLQQLVATAAQLRAHAGATAPDEPAAAPGDELSALARDLGAIARTLIERNEQRARSEKQLREVTDHLPVLIAYVDAERTLRFANARFDEAHGAPSPGALVGRALAEACRPDVYAEVEPHVERALEGERQRFERRAPECGADAVHLVDYIPDLDADGRVLGFFAMASDVSDSRRAALGVARSEQRLLDLMNNMPALVGYFDMRERCQYANEAGLRAQGWERRDLPGLSLRAALGEASYPQHEPFVKEVLQGRRTRFEGKVPFRDRVAHFEAHLVPDRVEGGEQRGFYLMMFDITALKEARLRQAEVERKLRAITDNLPVLISYVDRDMRWRFANRTFDNWIGVDPAALLERRVDELMPPDLFTQQRPYLEQALAGARVEFEATWALARGTRHVQTVYVPDIEPDGRVAGVYALSHDVTAMKEVETRLVKMARHDTLTGLPNRLLFNETLPLAFARAHRAGRGLALLALDVDHFKHINDTHGHLGGDAVLREFAARLEHSVRVTDTVARLAGDEFVIILEGLHSDAEPQFIARKLIAAINRPFELDVGPLAVTTSVGIAYHGADELALQPAALLGRADEALYAAKAAGRNTFRLAGALTKTGTISPIG